MKTPLKLSLRKIQHHIPQLLGLLLLIGVGSLFLITVFTISLRYEESGEAYFQESAYADATFYGLFTQEQVELLEDKPDIQVAQGRRVEEIRDRDRVFRIITLTSQVNRVHLYEGDMPTQPGEALMLERNAEALGVRIGSSLSLQDRDIRITGVIGSPEYIYLTKDQRTAMADPEQLVVLFVDKQFFTDPLSPGDKVVPESMYNEILLSSDTPKEGLQTYQHKVSSPYIVMQEDQLNVVNMKADLKQINTFAYIFPLIFSILVVAIIIIMVSRTIQRDRKQIGCMKALGTPSSKIATVYLVQFGLAGFIGSLLGCVATVFVTDLIIEMLGSMFRVPGLHFVVYSNLWIGTVVVATLLCLGAGAVSLYGILQILPAKAMISKPPAGGKSVVLEHTFLWKRLSFNSRYAIKSAMRNKGRFGVVVLGMTASCALLVFSFGFNNSLDNMKQKYFNTFINYDIAITVDPTPLAMEAPIDHLDRGGRALLLPVEVADSTYILTVVESGEFDFLNLPTEALDRGVVIPDTFARAWGVSEGDTLRIDGWDAQVSRVITQYMGLSLFTSYDYTSGITDTIPPLYNTIYGQTNSLAGVTENLTSQGVLFTTIDEDKKMVDALTGSTSVLVWFLIACALLLGVVVLYSVGLINLSTREYEYMFMGIMGYSLKGIMIAHIKETLWHILIALPLGFLLGNLLLEGVKDDFSTASFALIPAIYPSSYIVGGVAVVVVTTVMTLVMGHGVRHLDLIQGLKAQDE